MGVVFLILSHLFVATSLSQGSKLVFILLAFFGSLFGVAATWLVRYASPYFAYLLMSAWIALWVSYLVMMLVPLYEMWLRPG
jgi:hypothetical protein